METDPVVLNTRQWLLNSVNVGELQLLEMSVGLVTSGHPWWRPDMVIFSTLVSLSERNPPETMALIQYKDAILPVKEIPLWR